MKKLIIIFVIGFAVTQSAQGALLLTVSAAMAFAIMWVLQKLGVLSAPRRMSNAAGNAIRREYNKSVLRDIIRRALR